MAKSTKAKVDGNGQPAKGGNRESTQQAALMAEIAEIKVIVGSARDRVQQAILSCGWFAMEYGNLKPMSALADATVGMHRKGIVALCERAFGVKAEKDKDTKIERFKADESFAAKRSAYKADKKAFAKEVRSLGNFWDFKPDNAFEGLDYLKMLIAAGNKVTKAAGDKNKADKVKGAEFVSKVNAFILSLQDDDADEDGGTASIEPMPEASEHAAVH